MLKISVSGVRGIANESLTPEVCLNFAKAFSTYLKGGKIVVATDTRASSEFIKGIVLQGLFSCGAKIIDLGIAPTPTVGFMVRELKADGGLMVTASHNPAQWNGLKFIREDGIFLNAAQMGELISLYDKKEFIEKKGGQVKHHAKPYDAHINRVVRSVKASLIRQMKFKVVYDAVNGAGSLITGMLLKKLGCQVIPLHADPKQPFPHGAEPTPINLVDLCEKVKQEKAVIGFAQDPDADRLALVIDGGEAVSEEYTLALAVQHVLARSLSSNRIVVINLSTSKITEDVAKAAGAVVVRTKIGEVHVAEEIKKVKAVIGGEGNGGVIYPKMNIMRDSLAGMALILEMLAVSQKNPSELIAALPKYYLYKGKLDCSGAGQMEKIMESAIEIFKDETVDLTDGIKVYLPNGSLHVRPSNTEPIVRIFSEAKSAEKARQTAEELIVRLNP